MAEERPNRPVAALHRCMAVAAWLCQPAAVLATTAAKKAPSAERYRELTNSVLIGLAIISVVAAVVGFLGWRWYRQYKAEDSTIDTGFTLSDLRRMHRNGDLTDEQYEQARAAIIGMTQRQVDADAPEEETASDWPRPKDGSGGYRDDTDSDSDDEEQTK